MDKWNTPYHPWSIRASCYAGCRAFLVQTFAQSCADFDEYQKDLQVLCSKAAEKQLVDWRSSPQNIVHMVQGTDNVVPTGWLEWRMLLHQLNKCCNAGCVPYDKGTCEIFLSEYGIPLLNNSIETIGHKNSLKPHQLNECRNDCGDKQESLLGMT